MATNLSVIGLLVAIVGLPDAAMALDQNVVHLDAYPSQPSAALPAISRDVEHGRSDRADRVWNAWRSLWRILGDGGRPLASLSFDGALVAAAATFPRPDASLVGPRFPGASLIGVRIDDVTLLDAGMRSTDLPCANARDCRFLMEETRLSQAEPSGPGAPAGQPGTAGRQGDACDPLRAAKGPKLDKAVLNEATLEDADLSNASLREATVAGAKDAKNVDLQNACLCGADLRGVNLSGAKLAGASLRSAELAGATLPRDLRGVVFEGANIKGAIFSGDQTGGSDLTGANLAHVVQVDRPKDFKPVCTLPSASTSAVSH